MNLSCHIESPLWSDTDPESLARLAVVAVLTDRCIALDGCEVSLLATDDAGQAALNAEHRGKARPTNVLSWPAQNLAPKHPGIVPLAPQRDAFGDIVLGDIALAYETCAREAAEQGKSLADHVTHLIVHGTLHLLGYDHVRDADATVMEGLETAILAKLGIADPYT